MQLQTVLAASNIWQWRYMMPMLMIWRTMLMAMELEGLLKIGVISKPLKLRYAHRESLANAMFGLNPSIL